MSEMSLRDQIALSLKMEEIQFGSYAHMAEYVGEEIPSGMLEEFALSFRAVAKMRYAYADAMLAERGKGL